MLIIITRNIICIVVLMLILPILAFASLLIFVEDGLPVFLDKKGLVKIKKFSPSIKLEQ